VPIAHWPQRCVNPACCSDPVASRAATLCGPISEPLLDRQLKICHTADVSFLLLGFGRTGSTRVMMRTISQATSLQLPRDFLGGFFTFLAARCSCPNTLLVQCGGFLRSPHAIEYVNAPDFWRDGCAYTANCTASAGATASIGADTASACWCCHPHPTCRGCHHIHRCRHCRHQRYQDRCCHLRHHRRCRCRHAHTVGI
jgi:hypothetical protein